MKIIINLKFINYGNKRFQKYEIKLFKNNNNQITTNNNQNNYNNNQNITTTNNNNSNNNNTVILLILLNLVREDLKVYPTLAIVKIYQKF